MHRLRLWRGAQLGIRSKIEDSIGQEADLSTDPKQIHKIHTFGKPTALLLVPNQKIIAEHRSHNVSQTLESRYK